MKIKNNTRTRTLTVTYGALIAALYVTLTYFSSMLGLSSGMIQIRLSEVLTILPALFSPTYAVGVIGGLYVGCLLANVLTGCLLWDIIFGSLATLLGAIGTFLMRKHPGLAWIPPVLANVIIVPPILRYVYMLPDLYLFLVLGVLVGEVVSCGLLGYLLRRTIGNRIKKM